MLWWHHKVVTKVATKTTRIQASKCRASSRVERKKNRPPQQTKMENVLRGSSAWITFKNSSYKCAEILFATLNSLIHDFRPKVEPDKLESIEVPSTRWHDCHASLDQQTRGRFTAIWWWWTSFYVNFLSDLRSFVCWFHEALFEIDFLSRLGEDRVEFFETFLAFSRDF